MNCIRHMSGGRMLLSAICDEERHVGGGCGRRCVIEVMVVGRRCEWLNSIGGTEDLYMICVGIVAVQHTGQCEWWLQ